MSNEFDPIVDQWYYHQDKGQRFLITAVDEHAGTVEVQHFDGDIEEFSLDEWRELDIALSEEPENWSGVMDIAEQDDLGTEITDTNPADWSDPLKEFPETKGERPREDTPAPGEDYGEGDMEEEPTE